MADKFSRIEQLSDDRPIAKQPNATTPKIKVVENIAISRWKALDVNWLSASNIKLLMIKEVSNCMLITHTMFVLKRFEKAVHMWKDQIYNVTYII